MKIWEGCYEESWKGVLPAAAIAHPAKFSKNLIERILDHMEAEQWIEKEDVIADPFAGVASGGVIAVYRGFRWIGVELEPHFHELGNVTLTKHRARWHQLFPGSRDMRAALIRGDSREFDKIIRATNAIVTSPPYVSGGHHNDVFDAWNVNSRGQKIDKRAAGYGKTEGQIGRLKEGSVHAVVSSPPFLQSHGGERGIIDNGIYGKDKGIAKRQYRAEVSRSKGNIEGCRNAETYWHAVDKVYSACFRALRPGGVMALVVKDYVRAGKRQRFCDHTWDLLEFIGFQQIERVHAKLVQHYVGPDLFDSNHPTPVKTRKSFFRRLHESRNPACKIDEEEVLFVRRP